MIEKKEITQVVTRFIDGSDTFLVAVKVSPANEIEVIVDSTQAVSLEQCVVISRAIEAAFYRDEEDYELTVSSAGLDQPLQVFPQYLKYVGKEVEVLFYSGKKIKAVLVAATPAELSLQYTEMRVEEGKKRKKKTVLTELFKMKDIKTTKPVINFK